MHVSFPDSSILLRALETMIKKVLQAYPEVKFRIDLTKNELQLQGRPTLEAVLRFYTHVLAELQMIAPVAGGTTTPSIKAIGAGQSGGTGDASTPTSSPTKRGGARPPCKFFLSKSGCHKGAGCKYEHVFESKEDKKARCWECGSTTHRRNECPVIASKNGKSGKLQNRPDNQPASSSTSVTLCSEVPDGSPTKRQQAILESIQAVQQAVEGVSSTTSQSMPLQSVNPQSSGSVAPPATQSPSEADVKELLKEANVMLNKLTKLQALEVKTNQSIGELSAAIKAAGLDSEDGFALLDSGASHAFKQLLVKWSKLLLLEWSWQVGSI